MTARWCWPCALATRILGRSFPAADGTLRTGLGLLDARTIKGSRRAVGEVLSDAGQGPDMPPGGPPLEQLTGFENHAGVTMLGPKAQPLGRLVAGVGNGDGTEGAVSGRVVGTYLHGPVLARNPALADLLLGWALRGSMSLAPLDDHLIDQLRAERLSATVGRRGWRWTLARRR